MFLFHLLKVLSPLFLSINIFCECNNPARKKMTSLHLNLKANDIMNANNSQYVRYQPIFVFHNQNDAYLFWLKYLFFSSNKYKKNRQESKAKVAPASTAGPMSAPRRIQDAHRVRILRMKANAKELRTKRTRTFRGPVFTK